MYHPPFQLAIAIVVQILILAWRDLMHGIVLKVTLP
jgi:hypothetical protein